MLKLQDDLHIKFNIRKEVLIEEGNYAHQDETSLLISEIQRIKGSYINFIDVYVFIKKKLTTIEKRKKKYYG